MVVQCEACQTRFRLADEKIKAGGTKVRCSKCKQIFTVTQPEPEQEPTPTEETVDFGSFNMEEVPTEAPPAATPENTTEQAATAALPQEEPEPPAPEAIPQDQVSTPEESELDFSALEQQMGDSDKLGEEFTEDFSFADTSQLGDDNNEPTASPDESQPSDEPEVAEFSDTAQTALDSDIEDSSEFPAPSEFSFGESSETTDNSALNTDKDDFAEKESSFETNEFSLDEETEPSLEQESTFGDEGDDNAFSFDDEAETATSAPEVPAVNQEETAGPSEFSFDEDGSFGEEESSSEWDDKSSGVEDTFDFEEPQFETSESAAEESTGDDSLQFGEIDFSDGSEETKTPDFGSDNDFSKATMQVEETSEPDFSPQQRSEPSPSRDYDDDEALPAPPQQKSKGALSRILTLLALLLVVLGGAAGFLYMQNGSINLHQVAEYLPFLQEYIGEPPATDQSPRIGINISGSSYVNGKEGQLLVIQGEVVNDYSVSRSAITVKGVLLDKQGKTLLQQTVSSGNYMNEDALKSLPFAEIEEAMNNQFGASLSNMNVAAKASIPFTIVFRNVPAEIANINVEVVDSIPGD